MSDKKGLVHLLFTSHDLLFTSHDLLFTSHDFFSVVQNGPFQCQTKKALCIYYLHGLVSFLSCKKGPFNIMNIIFMELLVQYSVSST